MIEIPFYTRENVIDSFSQWPDFRRRKAGTDDFSAGNILADKVIRRVNHLIDASLDEKSTEGILKLNFYYSRGFVFNDCYRQHAESVILGRGTIVAEKVTYELDKEKRAGHDDIFRPVVSYRLYEYPRVKNSRFLEMTEFKHSNGERITFFITGREFDKNSWVSFCDDPGVLTKEEQDQIAGSLGILNRFSHAFSKN